MLFFRLNYRRRSLTHCLPQNRVGDSSESCRTLPKKNKHCDKTRSAKHGHETSHGLHSFSEQNGGITIALSCFFYMFLRHSNLYSYRPTSPGLLRSGSTASLHGSLPVQSSGGRRSSQRQADRDVTLRAFEKGARHSK